MVTKKTRNISFTLVVDDFGVTYTKKEDFLHIQPIIDKSYPTTTDWTGNQFIGIHLYWNYKICKLKVSMPGYVKRLLL